MPALVMEAVRKTYRSGDDEVVALDHADLVVGEHEMVTLVGPSGSGKTTLLSIAGGLLTASDGRVVVGETDVSRLNPRAAHDVPTERGRLRLPVRQPGAVPDRPREPHGGQRARRPAPAGDGGAGRPSARRARAGPAGPQPGRSAVRRRAPAGRHRPGTDERAEARPRRRADVGARHEARGVGDGAAPVGDHRPGRRRRRRHPRHADDALHRPHASRSSTAACACRRDTPKRAATSTTGSRSPATGSHNGWTDLGGQATRTHGLVSGGRDVLRVGQ